MAIPAVAAPPSWDAAVTHHERVLRAHRKHVERPREHARIWLLNAVLEGQNPGIEEVGDAVVREHRAQVQVKVADEGDHHPARMDLAQDVFRVRVEEVVGRIGVEPVQRLGQLRIEPVPDEHPQGRLPVQVRRRVDVRQVAGLLERSCGA